MTTLAPPPYVTSSSTTTPADYHKLLPSVQLPLPEQKFVGLLACQRDPLLQTLQTTITSVELSAPAAPAPATGGKKVNKTRKTATEVPDAVASAVTTKIYKIETLDSCLFPEGGGQPSDAGTIRLAAGSAGEATGKESKVLHVLRAGLAAIHYVELAEGEREFAVGDEVVFVVDWERRVDHMTHHTAQHVLSALLDNLPSPISTLSWSLTSRPQPCYVELDRAPTDDELAHVEREANRLIREGTRVFVEVDDQERKGVDVVEEQEIRQSRKGIPKDYQAGVVRTIVVSGLDRNPCCGTHVPSLSLIQAVHIHPLTTPHSSTTRRLHFLASTRVFTHLRTQALLVAAASRAMGGVAPEAIPERTAQLVETSKAADKSLKLIKTELAEGLAKGLRERLAQEKVVFDAREGSDAGTVGTDFLGVIGAGAVPAAPAPEGCLLILSGSQTPFLANGGTSSLYLAGAPALVASFGERIKQAPIFQGRVKGGGARGRWQAKIEGAFGPGEKAWVEAGVEELRKEL